MMFRRPKVVSEPRTGWQSFQTAASGLAPQTAMTPIQKFRVMRVGSRVLVDLTGLRLNQDGQGIANLGELPHWATAAIPNQYFWVNDSPHSLHASQCAVFQGQTLYWTAQVNNGLLVVNRPETLRGGFEFTTITKFPTELQE